MVKARKLFLRNRDIRSIFRTLEESAGGYLQSVPFLTKLLTKFLSYKLCAQKHICFPKEPCLEKDYQM